MTLSTIPATTTTRLRHAVGSKVLAFGRRVRRKVRGSLLADRPDLVPALTTLGTYPVAVYFGEPPVRAYQILQWLPTIEQLDRTLPVAIVTRNEETAKLVAERTGVQVVFARTLDALMQAYTTIDVKVVVYPNYGMRNFQSLIHRPALHVHVNHGESDKVSMVSNQAKAYDHVVVAGQAAIDRHEAALINFDVSSLVVCGRPQLDLAVPRVLDEDPARRTVMYAPTWSGENEANNYTSVDVYGPQIVEAVLSRPGTRLVYKPHPRVALGDRPPVAAAHARILALVAAANEAAGEPVHHVLLEEDILGLMDGTDLLVTDVSSVGLDFLYLRTEAPLVLTDRRSDPEQLAIDAPVSRACDVIDRDTVGTLGELLDANLHDDPRSAARAAMRSHYFGVERGESTARFIEFITSCVDRRDGLLAGSASVRATGGYEA